MGISIIYYYLSAMSKLLDAIKGLIKAEETPPEPPPITTTPPADPPVETPPPVDPPADPPPEESVDEKIEKALATQKAEMEASFNDKLKGIKSDTTPPPANPPPPVEVPEGSMDFTRWNQEVKDINNRILNKN